MIENGRLRWWEPLLLVAGLLLFVGQAFLSSPQKSASFDEEYHLAAGYAYLKTGDFRLSQDHPPLINVLSAFPLLFRSDIVLPLHDSAWAQRDYFNFAHRFLWDAQANPQSILEWARWPVMGLGAVLVAALFWWARQLAGPPAGWIALLLALFDPNLIAHSRLVTTDLGVTCFMLLAMWRLWHWLTRPSLPNALFTGLFAGLAMVSKYTGLMIWPMLVAVTAIYSLGDLESGAWKKSGRLRISHFLVMGLIAYFVLWAAYRFDIAAWPGTNISFPASFYAHRVWETYQVIEDEPLASFLLGQTSQGGWWYYFPVALAVKSSLPLLIFAALGAFMSVKAMGWRKSSVLWLPPLLFLLLAMAGNITIGYRHILPALPFIIMLAAQMGRCWQSPYRWRNLQFSLAHLFLMGLLLWHAVGTLRLFPHQEAFFNELVGGAAGGGRVLADSNLDWGQDLITLGAVMQQQGITEVNLGYFGTAVPERYGIRYKPLPGFLSQLSGAEVNAYNPYTPPPGWYAISQTSLQLGLMLQNRDIYAYFQDKTPTYRAGYSINLYHVTYPDGMPVDRRVVSGTAVSDMSPQDLGILDGRRLITKWTTGAAATIIPFTEPFTPPDDFQPAVANYADIMTLVGYTVAAAGRPGEPVQLALFWQRGTAPIPMPAPARAAPLATFVHLTGAEPTQIVAQYDGWDTAVTTLEPGDIIIQHLTLTPPAETAPGVYLLLAGLYSPQSDRRFALTNGSGDFITLTSLTIIE